MMHPESQEAKPRAGLIHFYICEGGLASYYYFFWPLESAGRSSVT